MTKWDEAKLGPKVQAKIIEPLANDEPTASPIFDDAPQVTPIVPCASLYDEHGRLPRHAEQALQDGAAAAQAQHDRGKEIMEANKMANMTEVEAAAKRAALAAARRPKS